MQFHDLCGDTNYFWNKVECNTYSHKVVSTILKQYRTNKKCKFAKKNSFADHQSNYFFCIYLPFINDGMMWIISLKKYFIIFAYLSVVTRLQITRSYIEHMSLLNYFFEQAIFWIMIWVKYFESNKLGVELSDDDYSYRFDLSPINSSRTRLYSKKF